MARRLILGSSVVVAGLTIVGLWLQATAVAQQQVPRDKFGNIITSTAIQEEPVTPSGKTEVKEVPAPFAKATPHQFRTEVKSVPKRRNLVNIAADASSADLQDAYLDLHRRIAERLTPEQLSEKCKALEKELNEIIAEDEIEQIQKQLSELKRKNPDNKGISTRVQRAIDDLKNTTPELSREL